MTAERQQFSLALGLSTLGNALLVLAIAWAMAVTQGLRASSPLSPLPAAEPLPDVVSLVLSPEPPTDPSPPQKAFVNSPDDQPDQAPSAPDPAFISSANLRAASEAPPDPQGIPNRVSQPGLDLPTLDLRDSTFRDGPTEASRPREAAPPQLDSPPEPAPAEKIPEAPPAAPQNPPAPPAFREKSAESLIPLPEPPAPRTRPLPPRPAPRPLPLDRPPDAASAPGLRKAKSLGTISNRGRASVDALATAEGRFGKAIRTAIERTWQRRMLTLSGLANPGLVEVDFEVDAKGRISNVKLANPGEANPVMQDCALSAVIDAKLPPPPPELLENRLDSLTGGRMRCSFSFLIY